MIRVFACESQPVVVEGLRLALQSSGEFEFTGSAPNPASALEAVRAHHPDVVLVNHEDGDEPTLALVQEIRRALETTRPVLWVRDPADMDAQDAFDLGAGGVLPKSRSIEVLRECLRTVAAGRFWPETTGLRQHPLAPGDRRRIPRLTPRERQVVDLISKGMKNAQIATELAISPGTVKVHLMHVFEKTGMRDRFELAIRSRKLLGANVD